MTTNNTPTLLACLRAIGESGRTKLIQLDGGQLYFWFEGNTLYPTEFGLTNSIDLSLKIQYCLIQIAKEQRGIDLFVKFEIDGEVEMLVLDYKAFKKGRTRKVFFIGLDGIQNMPHALALGLAKIWELEVSQ